MTTKLQAQKEQFQESLSRFKEALQHSESDMVRDSSIQRFEFTLDICWKTLKTFLEEEKGIVCNSPKECFREAFRQRIVEHEEKWLKLVNMRNETVHTYNEEMAEDIYHQLPEAAKAFEELFNKIK